MIFKVLQKKLNQFLYKWGSQEKVKESMEKTTLGDLGVLSNLKTEMEAAEKKKGDDNE